MIYWSRHDCYGGTYRLFQTCCGERLVPSVICRSNRSCRNCKCARAKPKLVWIETSNPLLRVVDIAAICQQSHAVGALVAVDNTFLSPLLQQPLALGADIVVHSTTKYLNGHSDVVGGAVIAKEPELHEN